MQADHGEVARRERGQSAEHGEGEVIETGDVERPVLADLGERVEEKAHEEEGDREVDDDRVKGVGRMQRPSPLGLWFLTGRWHRGRTRTGGLAVRIPRQRARLDLRLVAEAILV